MGYKHVTLENRQYIAGRFQEGNPSTPGIARGIDHTTQTVRNEIRNNGDRKPDAPKRKRFFIVDYTYDADVAHARACARRGHSRGIRKPAAVQAAARRLLQEGRTPYGTSEALREMRLPASVVWVYKYAWALIAEKALGMSVFPRLGVPYKSSESRRTGGCSRIPGRRSIAERPPEASALTEAGHVEADTVHGKDGSGFVLVTVDKATRYVRACMVSDLRAATVSAAMCELLAGSGVRTITMDNGSEFTRHQEFSAALGAATFFCNPGSPGERGSVENVNGHIRRRFPKRHPFPADMGSRLPEWVRWLNTRAMRVLGGRTPEDVHWEMAGSAGMML